MSWILIFLYVVYIRYNEDLSDVWFGITNKMFTSQIAIDCAVNVICLYLQYPFAKKHYNTYCGCIGNFWRFVFIKKAEKAMKKKFRNVHHAGPVNSNSINMRSVGLSTVGVTTIGMNLSMETVPEDENVQVETTNTDDEDKDRGKEDEKDKGIVVRFNSLSQASVIKQWESTAL